MSNMNRRGVLRLAATAAGANALPPACAIGDGREQGQAEGAQDDRWAKEREYVTSVGFTEAEAECWEFTARAAGGLFALPEIHETDAQKVA